jgi:hypothetical protein
MFTCPYCHEMMHLFVELWPIDEQGIFGDETVNPRRYKLAHSCDHVPWIEVEAANTNLLKKKYFAIEWWRLPRRPKTGCDTTVEYKANH